MKTTIAQHGMSQLPTPLSPTVRVDVKLCGSTPRSEIADSFQKDTCRCPASPNLQNQLPSKPSFKLSPQPRGSPCGELTSSHLNVKSSLYDGLERIVSQPTAPSTLPATPLLPLPVYEPPAWSVPARGESRLEPVCEGLGRQSSVDLTSRSSFRIGRSPQSDVQLQHYTSSRRHALMFHHSNGSCYIVDCGSAHGTYVNGVRVQSPPNGGMVVPYKVRRGAMIRFGGPGAPCFVLKSFAFELDELVESSSNLIRNDSSEEEAVQQNTRLNALGQTAMDSIRLSLMNLSSSSLDSKRSFDSLDCASTMDSDDSEPFSKRARCSSPTLFAETPLRLVSPDVPAASKQRRVSFSAEPPMTFYPALVTPGDLSGEEDNGAY